MRFKIPGIGILFRGMGSGKNVFVPYDLLILIHLDLSYLLIASLALIKPVNLVGSPPRLGLTTLL